MSFWTKFWSKRKEAESTVSTSSEGRAEGTEAEGSKLATTMSSIKNDEESKAKLSDTLKDDSLEKIQQILKTLPVEQLKILKHNIFDNLDKLNQETDISPETSDIQDVNRLNGIVGKEKTSLTDVDMDNSDEATTMKPKSMETEGQKSKEKELGAKKKDEVMEIMELCLDDLNEEDAASKPTKVSATDEKSKDKPTEPKTKAANEKKVSTTKRVFNDECINSNCEKKIDSYFEAPEFALNVQELNASVRDKTTVFSDEEGEENIDDNNGNYLIREELWMLHDECDKTSEKIINVIDPQSQLEMATRYSKTKIAVNNVLIGKLNNNFLKIDKKSTNMNNKVRILERPAVEFSDPQPINKEFSQKRKMDMIENKMEKKKVAKDLAQKASSKRNNIDVHEGSNTFHSDTHKKLYFALRPRSSPSTWSTCEVLDEKVVDSNKLYHVKFLDGTMETQVTGRYLAVINVNENSRLTVGKRVLAYFSILSNGTKQLAPGVIGESLEMSNRYRYLVFGDDGNVEYISKDVVFPVLDQSENVWEDVDINLRQFLREYLSSEPSKQRKELIVQKGQRICIDRNDTTMYATVIDIDCSIIKIQYADAVMEWVYRGSKLLASLKSTDNLQNSFQRRNAEPSMQYDNITVDDYQAESPNIVRAVARKSTSGPSNHLQSQHQQQPQLVPLTSSTTSAQPGNKIKILNDNKIYIDDPTKVSIVRNFTPKDHIKAKKFVIHNCGPECLPQNNFNLLSYSPLLKPLLTCWERLLVKHKSYKAIMYTAPCGRRLRNMNEVHNLLKICKSPLNVENFDFDITMEVLAAVVVDKQLCGLYINDITEDQEGMKIPVVNAFENQKPPPLEYSSKRIPTTGVNINTDPEFLSCCDCTDDCFDKTKCQCFRLTIEGAKFNDIMEQPTEEISYVYKRLLHTVPTGIYECNSNCECSNRCLNRVVQQPIQVKIQLFRTKNRGWGLEALHDIPKGTFICNYTGLIYTEEAANEMCNKEGVEHGDEYFAALDHIETTQTIKEGYEENVRDLEDDEKDFSKDSVLEADLEDHDNNDLRFKTNAIQSNSTPTDLSQSDSQKKQRQSAKQPLAAPKAVETVQKYDPHKFRKLFGPKERVYIMDAKTTGNIARYFNHSCDPNIFVQNVFVDTHDLRFPWISFFTSMPIKAGEELTWDYSYEVGSVPNKVLYCNCGAKNCRNRIL